MAPRRHQAAVAHFIRHATRLTTVPMLPEVRLHLLAAEHYRWGLDDVDAAAVACGLPSGTITLPFWAFAWPGGVTVSRYLFDTPRVLDGCGTVLDLGCGCGVGAIAASLVQPGATVVANDVDAVALDATRLNAAVNGVASVRLSSADLLHDSSAVPLAAGDVVLAGDIMYDEQLGDRALTLLSACASAGATVLLSDPGRWALQLLVDRGHEGAACMHRVATYKLDGATSDLGDGRPECHVWQLQGTPPV